MKLATLKDASRDGALVVVARDLKTAHFASGIAATLQNVLDDWNFLAPQLQDLYDKLNADKTRYAFPFEPQQCMAPLPRAYQCVRANAALNLATPGHLPSGHQMADDFFNEPQLYQCASDDFGGACDDFVVPGEACEVDIEAQVAVITGDVRMGAAPAQALEGVRLLMLANHWRLRDLVAQDMARGWGLLRSLSAVAFSPVAVTTDEVGSAWHGGQLHLMAHSQCNGRTLGLCDMGHNTRLDFGQLIAHLSTTRNLRAGSIVMAGAASMDSKAGTADKDQQPLSQGYRSIAEKRAFEILSDGHPNTAFLTIGDKVRLDVKGQKGHSVFGAIEQQLVALAEDVRSQAAK